jgi:HSP20 family protein
MFSSKMHKEEGAKVAKEVTPWRPFEFERIRREMDRIWDSFLEDSPVRRIEKTGEWLASIDVSETKSDMIIRAELPGTDPKDIDISLSDGYLTIKGEKIQDKEEKDEDYHLTERTYGSFSRSVRLPVDVQGDKIKASFKHGVLMVRIPKSEELKKKEIKIKVE